MRNSPEAQHVIEKVAAALMVEQEAVERAIERAMFRATVEELKQKSEELNRELQKLKNEK